MSQILSVGLLAICVLLLVAHFIDIKKSSKNHGK
jgi:hypothetical protein